MQQRSQSKPRRDGRPGLIWALALFLSGLGCWIWAPWQRTSRTPNIPRAAEEKKLEPEQVWSVASPTSPAETSSAAKLAQRFKPSSASPVGELIAQLLDKSAPLNARRRAARMLGRESSDEAMAALRAALQDGPPYLKAAIAEGLGESTHAQGREMLMGLLNDQDETVVRGALRGFAARGDSEAVEILGNVLFNPQKPESVRTEAALALGDVAQPGALNALVRAVNELQDPALSESILEGLGKRPFAETETFFSTWLESSGVSADFKVTALEALGNSSGDVAPLLLKYASDQDPEVRAAAAWALSASPTQTDVGPQLLDLLSHEASPEVRTRLYQALAGQENYDVETVLSLTQKEFEPSARLAALNLLAEGCRSRPSSELLNYFNASAVPELKSIALTDRESQRRLSSVMTLRRADTAESVNALQEIAQRSTDTRTVDAANSALRARLHL